MAKLNFELALVWPSSLRSLFQAEIRFIATSGEGSKVADERRKVVFCG